MQTSAKAEGGREGKGGVYYLKSFHHAEREGNSFDVEELMNNECCFYQCMYN